MIKMYFVDQPIPGNEPYAYIVAKEGFYILKRNELFDACVKIDTLPLPEQEETFVLKAKKIPYELIKEVLAFFHAVYQKYRSEAMVLLCYEQDNWSAYAPEQEVAGARVQYKNESNRRVVGSVHSHPGFGVFASGTDHQDELNFDGLHLIVSKFDEVKPELACYVVINGKRAELEPESVIEGLNEPIRMVNQEWLKKVKPLQEPFGEREDVLGKLETDKKPEDDKGNVPLDDECFCCSHEDVCIQEDIKEPGSPCDFFDYSKEKDVVNQRLFGNQRKEIKL